MTEAVFNDAAAFAVTPEMIDDVKQRALRSERGRFRICLHADVSHPTQEMVIACRAGTYFRPHRHPVGRSESVHIIEGRLTIGLFDDAGTPQQWISLDSAGGTSPILYRLADSVYHWPVPRSGVVVYHEVFTGPFEGTASEPAPWSPDEADPAGVAVFMKRYID